MTTTDSPVVDNGVNVQALLGAREALSGAPEAVDRYCAQRGLTLAAQRASEPSAQHVTYSWA